MDAARAARPTPLATPQLGDALLPTVRVLPAPVTVAPANLRAAATLAADHPTAVVVAPGPTPAWEQVAGFPVARCCCTDTIMATAAAAAAGCVLENAGAYAGWELLRAWTGGGAVVRRAGWRWCVRGAGGRVRTVGLGTGGGGATEVAALP